MSMRIGSCATGPRSSVARLPSFATPLKRSARLWPTRSRRTSSNRKGDTGLLPEAERFLTRIVAVLDLEPRDLSACGIGRVETLRDDALNIEFDRLSKKRLAVSLERADKLNRRHIIDDLARSRLALAKR